MKKKNLLFAIVILLSAHLFAQTPKIIYKKTASGLEYAIIKKGKGQKTKKGYRIYVNFTTRINPDSIFDSNVNSKKPFTFILGQEEVLKGWEEGISLLSEGDSALFRIPPGLAYGDKKRGSIPPNSTLLLAIKIVKSEQAFYDLNGKDTVSFKSGLKKIVVSAGKGDTAKAFNNVILQFTGYTLNKKGYKVVFQSSLTNSALANFQLSTGRFIKGLDEGLVTMKVGEKSTFIVPPALGFGKEKAGIIPENSILYFDIELISSADPFYHPINKDTIYGKNGIKILPVLKQEGKKITKENVVIFNYTGYFIDSLGHSIIFDKAAEFSSPAVFRPGSKGLFPGLGDALTYLTNNEKAIIYIPAKLAFGEKGKGIIPPNKAIIYDIHIIQTQTYPFFDANGLDTVKTNSGLKYIQVRKGTGTPVDSGSTVSVAYTGFIIDSLGTRNIFDATRESHKNFDFVLGKGAAIKGFDEGIKGMCIGEGRRLIIPYTLGYGEKGMPEQGIPEKATLYFDVELLSLKKP